MNRLHARDVLGVLVVSALLIAVGSSPAQAATTLYVDQGGGCRSSGPGTSAKPFCTLKAAGSVARAGDTVLVRPGTYRETLTVRRAGLTFRASGSGVVLDGAVPLPSADHWSEAGQGSWTLPLATTVYQVHVDGVALPASSADPLPPGTWRYDGAADLLRVHTDGGNPAEGAVVEATTLSYGVRSSGFGDLVVEGFDMRRHASSGVYISGAGATNVLVTGNTVSGSMSYGMRCAACGRDARFVGNEVSRSGSTGLLVRDTPAPEVAGNHFHHNDNHGLSVYGSPGAWVHDNTSTYNARPAVRAAVGIDVNGGSAGSLVERNTVHHNQDTGIQVWNASNDTTVRRNLTFRNGDHGIDVVRSTGVQLLGNTCAGNTLDGLSVEGTSPRATIADNICVDNGQWDLWVDKTSVEGLSADSDLLWKSSGGRPIKIGSTSYASTAALAAATGLEARGLTASPQFVDAGGDDYRLGSGSPAVDSADATPAGLSLTDLLGEQPFDDPAVEDTGVGTPAFLDRGALERVT